MSVSCFNENVIHKLTVYNGFDPYLTMYRVEVYIRLTWENLSISCSPKRRICCKMFFLSKNIRWE